MRKRLVRDLLGPHLNAVYSSEPSYEDYFRRAYPEADHRLVDVPRIHFPISSTRIREMKDKEERGRIFKKSRGEKFENVDVVLLGLLAPILLAPLIEVKSLELLSLES